MTSLPSADLHAILLETQSELRLSEQAYWDAVVSRLSDAHTYIAQVVPELEKMRSNGVRGSGTLIRQGKELLNKLEKLR